MKNFKYTTIFSSEIRPLVSEEKDKYLAMASLLDIGEFVPDLDTKTNVDLLPIAFNACVINRANKNDDVVDTDHGMAMTKHFINKPINIEHNRERVVGTILVAGFSEFGTDKPLTEKEVEGLEGPFNITLGGVIWKIVNSKLAEIIENSNDPTSEDYLTVSASWELGFSEYNIFAAEGEEKNIENAELIDDNDKVEELKDFLRGFGGDGKLEDGRRIYRHVVGEIIPLGVGLTETPAADVKGVAVKKKEEKEEMKADEKAGYPPDCNPGYKEENGKCVKIKTDAHETLENNEKISHLEEKNVNDSKDSTIMKITNINDITEESLKQLKASAVSDFINEEIKKVSDQYAAEQAQKEEVMKTTQDKFDSMSGELDGVKAELDRMRQEKAEQEAIALFKQRMTEFEEAFELDDESRAVIASDIKEMDEQAYSAYNGKMKKLMSYKLKKNLAEKAKADEVALKEAKEEGKAFERSLKLHEKKGGNPPGAVEEKTLEEKTLEEGTLEEVVEEAVENAEEVVETVTNTTDASEASLYEKYKDAFSIENFNIKL